MTISAWLKTELETLKQQSRYRQFQIYQPIDAGYVLYEGKKYLMLASNNYLGLTFHPEVIAAAKEAAQLYGAGSGGSRLTAGTYSIYQELETEIARFKGTEAALVFNSGYTANVGIISALMGSGDVIISDALNHASIIDGCRLSGAKIIIYQHKDMQQLEACLRAEQAARENSGKLLVVTDGVFSMDGDIAPLDNIVALAKKYKAEVMVDDAHATGVIGPEGKGTAAHFGIEQDVFVQVGTLSKALGAEGGFAAGKQELIEFLKNKARSFIFSTSLAPAVTAAALQAFKLLRNNPQLVTELRFNAELMRNLLKEQGFAIPEGQTPIIPVIFGSEDHTLKAAQRLLAEGFIVSAIRPPTVPVGTSRLRIAVSLGLNEQDIRYAAASVAKVRELL